MNAQPSPIEGSADDPTSSCCSPSRGNSGVGDVIRNGAEGDTSRASGTSTGIEFVDIPAGTLTMGSDGPSAWPAAGEGPARTVTLDAYRIGRDAVTNA